MDSKKGLRDRIGGTFLTVRTRFALMTAFFILLAMGMFYAGGRIVLIHYIRDTERQVKISERRQGSSSVAQAASLRARYGIAPMFSEAMDYYTGGFWRVREKIPKAFSSTTSIAFGRLAFFVAIFGMVFIIPLFWTQNRILMNPLTEMIRAIREMGEHAADVNCPRLEWKGKDEFAQLAESVNRMVETIAAKTVSLANVEASHQALIDGIPAQKRDPQILANLFYVPDEFALPHVSLKTYVRINSPFYPAFNKEVLNNCLAEFSMPLTLSRLDQLSLGQRKKVMLSFAIASGAKTILMDEPSNGLDIPSKAQFRKVMASAMTDDRLIVISTHQVHDVENLLDNIVIIDNDSILLNKSMGDLSEQLAFLTVAPGETVPEVLYSEPSIGGINVICNRQPDQDETQVNLEMLFNAVSKGLFKQ